MWHADLPSPPRPSGAYRPIMVIGDMAYLSGFGPRDSTGAPITGTVGLEFDVAASQEVARRVGLSILGTLQEALGDLDRVRQMVRVTGMIASVPGFTQHPQVLDGCSRLFIERLGERGAHARMAYGVASLPHGAPLAIDCICRIYV